MQTRYDIRPCSSSATCCCKVCHLRWIPILYNNAPPVWPFQGKLHSANYIKAKRGSTQKILPKYEDMKKTYWRKGTTKSGLAAYLEIFVSYNIKRSLSSRTQRKNLARMQYLEMFPRQNALSASCKASIKHSLCVIFYKVVKSSTDEMTLQGLQEFLFCTHHKWADDLRYWHNLRYP